MRSRSASSVRRTQHQSDLWRRLKSWQHTIPLLIASIAVLVANAPTLLHVVTTDPMQLFSLLPPAQPPHQLLSGRATIDPNAGFVTQANGALAAHDWLTGHIPWWNPYVGFGTPLAGSIQSAAFFPLVLLFAGGAYGSLAFHIILELIAAWSTYFLVRRLNVGRLGATVAACAFGLCGTFAWLANAVPNPVPFLPMALLGVELCRSSASQRRRLGGWALLAAAAALSIVAGFPEVAYLDGLLVVAWCIFRLPGLGAARLRFLGNVALGAVVGVAIAAPTEVAFLTYLPHANVGPHTGAVGNQAMAAQGAAQVVLPYVFGPIFGLHSTSSPDVVTSIWDIAGGYLSIVLVSCALWGLVGKRLRPLRVGLAAWTAVGILKVFGVPPVAQLITHFPGLSHVSTARYASASYEMAVVVLAALGIDDMVRGELRARVVVVCGAVCSIVVLVMAGVAWGVLTHTSGATHPHRFDVLSAGWAIIGVACTTTGAVLASRRTGEFTEDVSGSARAPRPGRRGATFLVAGAVIVDAVVLFAAPLVSAQGPVQIETGSVRFFQTHLGTDRFVTLGPIQPNYGAYFRIYELSLHDLPIPKGYSEYASKYLDTNAIPYQMTGTTRLNPSLPGPAPQLTQHLEAYERAGVKYVITFVTGADVFAEPWPTPGIEPAPKLVYSDSGVNIYQLGSTRPFFSAPGSACSVTDHGYDSAVVRCAKPATLLRLEEYMPGWHATIDGKGLTVKSADGPFQSVRVPAGVSTVDFSFVPPHGNAALVISLLAIIVMLGGLAADLMWSRRRKSRPMHSRAVQSHLRDPTSESDPNREDRAIALSESRTGNVERGPVPGDSSRPLFTKRLLRRSGVLGHPRR